MEYTEIWQPLLLIFITFLLGAILGSIFIYYKIKDENELLQIDIEFLKEIGVMTEDGIRLTHWPENLSDNKVLRDKISEIINGNPVTSLYVVKGLNWLW